MTQLIRDPAMPNAWLQPGQRAPEGHLPRMATIDPGHPDQVARRALEQAREELQGAREVTPALIKMVGEGT